MASATGTGAATNSGDPTKTLETTAMQNFDALVTYSLDALGRSMRDAVESVREIELQTEPPQQPRDYRVFQSKDGSVDRPRRMALRAVDAVDGFELLQLGSESTWTFSEAIGLVNGIQPARASGSANASRGAA